MELGLSNTLLAGDPRLVDHIVGEVKSQGIFDQFRKECIADVDTKPAYQNLRTRVEGSVNSFLSKQSWKPDLNKNQLRETLRKHIHEAPYLDAGVERIVDQVVNPKVYSVFTSQIEDVVYKFLGIERPKAKEKNGVCGLKDLLPKDLDPVSPESDKNSLKDVSLESVDAMEDLETKRDTLLANEQKFQDEEISNEKSRDDISENGQISCEEKALDESDKLFNKTGSTLNLNTSGKSDDKTEEDEEDSPTFEPIDIMNLNESNISNDSHLSGISELTSHRSRSPDFCNELSRDNFDYSNQDSQLSKVSSDSRLSIVTDFGSSNHASTPIHDTLKDESHKDKCDVKNKDNFKAVRDYESSKNKGNKNIFELNKSKDVQDIKDSKNIKNNLSSKENSRDATDSSIKSKYEHKNNKDRSRDRETKSKSKDKNLVKDGKQHRDRSSDKKKERSHSSSKYDKYDKSKSKDKSDQPKENTDKVKDTEKDNYTKAKEDKTKETDKKDNISKEGKDLKDLYKEKIRELREKKELTEKEKLNKDIKETKTNKENKDKKDSPKDKKPYKKDHKGSSKSSSSTSHEIKIVKMSEKMIDGKEKRSESKDKDKSRRDERRSSKDHIKSKNHVSTKSDSTERLDKQDMKKVVKNEREERVEKIEVKKDIKPNSEKLNGKKDIKSHTQSKSSTRSEKLDSKKDSKNDSQNKDKRRREEKKSKMKDDHSSLRRNSNDRRSTDRDGSNGSSSKSSQSSSSSSNIANSKSSASTYTKETNHMSNSGSETSDNIEEVHTSDLKLSLESNYKLDKELHTEYKTDDSGNYEMHIKQESEFNDINLPLKKRALLSDDNSTSGEVKVKKPKFAKNIHEAKKLMKIRKQIEKQKLKEMKIEKKFTQKIEQPVQSNTVNNDNFESMPDEERVQIIEIPDEEYEEPYPENHTNLTLEERSIIMLQTEAGTKDLLETHANLKLKLSDMELCIRQSLSETLPNKTLEKESIQESCSDIQIKLSDNNTTEELQTRESPSLTIEKKDNIVVKVEKIDDSVETCFKRETQQEAGMSKLEENVTSQKSNTFNIDTDKSNKDETDEQLNLTNSIHTDGVNHLNDNKNIEVPTTSKFRYDTQDTQSNSLSNLSDEDYVINDHKEQQDIESTSMTTEDNEECRYFKADNEKSEKFSSFLESLKLIENSSLEDIIESLGGQVVSSVPKAMAPPLPKRKHSSSPLTDILLNNSNNNNDGHKKALNLPNEEALNNIKRRKLVAPKKQRLQPNICAPQGLLNGENFVMPLSPESDVSATSEKISSNLIKEDKGRHRSSQRYSSDDLYKPRPLFSSSSRRSRRSNQV
ncbi:PREDICTED: biorientation of chromosomes in cell division protein 1-like 1 [Habropoda laboriosa]|uniref:biorientation of chromosomes in cell division protein 1-like 1 n=1 Tax=Habropoda laboriosa TaxID=597456 RepID=UPI00083D6874|nr:PREDICTED: biorientation of chromosomes in cell division protein 1-like 1 [Habropoda laboriosa]